MTLCAFHNIIQEALIKTIPKKMQKGKIIVWRGLANNWEKKQKAK